jgi:hypothetical protein
MERGGEGEALKNIKDLRYSCDINLSYRTHKGISKPQFLTDISYRVDTEGLTVVLPKTMTKVILIVLIFALGISPLELARLEFWSSMEISSPSANPNTKTFSTCVEKGRGGRRMEETA